MKKLFIRGLVALTILTFCLSHLNLLGGTLTVVAQPHSLSKQVINIQKESTTIPVPSYSTAGGNIYKDGQIIKLYGASWFGFEDVGHSAHALWNRNITEIISQIKGMGFNALRVPFCPETLRNVPTGYISEANNPSLVGLKSLDLLDAFLREANSQGLYILMDIHNYTCTHILPPLWYTDQYSEQNLIIDVTFVADRYKALDHFIGIDIKNEPHDGPTVETSATWGTGNLATDWNKAAERIGKSILTANPNLLIFVEGIGDKQTYCSDEYGAWWGGNLMPIRCTPIDPSFVPANKLVLSPHVYGPDVSDGDEFKKPDYPNNLPAVWDKYFGYTLGQGYTLAIGEFGGKYGHDDQYGAANPKDVAWQNKVIDYFIEKKICNFFYWSLNPDSSDTGGIFQPDWIHVRDDKLANIQRLMTSCSEPATKDPLVPSSVLESWSFDKYRQNDIPYLIGRLFR